MEISMTAVIVLVFLQLEIQLNVLGSSSSNYKICDTAECKESAKTLKAQMNFQMPPCDDFFSFACGRTEKSTLEIVRDGRLKKIKDVLMSPKIVFPKNHLQNVQAFYQGCIESENTHKADLLPTIKNALKKIGGMPLIADSGYDPALSWEEKLGALWRQFQIPAIFTLTIANTEMAISKITKFSVDKTALIGTDDYSKNLVSITKAYNECKICFLREIENCADDEELDEEINKVMDFEIKLAKLASQVNFSSEIAHSTSNYKMTVKEVIQAFPEIKWMAFFTNVFLDTGNPINEQTPLVVLNKGFFRPLIQLLAETDKRTIDNYLGLRMIDMFKLIATNVFRIDVFHYPDLLSILNDSPQKILEEFCLTTTISFFPKSVGRIFAEKHFSLQDKREVEHMLFDIQETMIDALKKNLWLDEETRTNAIKKMTNMKSYVGYPSWIFDDRTLEMKEAMPETCARKEFHSCLMKAGQYAKGKIIRKYHSSTDSKKFSKRNNDFESGRWKKFPVEYDLSYNELTNSMYLSEGALQFPLYGRSTLQSLNYGSLGFTIGHEVSHAFTVEGKEFDESGRRTNWFTNSSREEYEKRIRCYIDQYSKTRDNMTNIQVDGKKTLNENMADNGGVARAYQAYMKLNPEDIRLPGLDNISHKQLFFISQARLFCHSNDYEETKNTLLMDEHGLGKYRILLTMKNFQPFAEAYNCPKGSPMNPEHRCKMK